jgi:hypothetical protein
MILKREFVPEMKALWHTQHFPLPERSIRAMACLDTTKGALVMIKEEDVLAALDKPRALYPLQQRLDPSNKSTDALQELLMQMRTEGKVKFDIKSGRWSKA